MEADFSKKNLNKFKNERGEIGVMFGGADENFALSISNEGVVLDWIFDPNMIQMVLDYSEASTYDEFDKFTGDYELCEKIMERWGSYLKETYPQILEEEYSDQYPDIANVGVFFLKEGTTFVIIDRGIVNNHSYGEEVLITKTLTA